jgi:hydroxymethylpyrimidine/phosphomethylpyrimidine kinase
VARGRAIAALTVAGSDSSGGAGIQADLRTFEAHGVAGACAVTAVTIQDSERVHEVFALPSRVVAEQIRTVVAGMDVRAAKTGMLATASVVEAAATSLGEWKRAIAPTRRWLVVDPVLSSHAGGAELLELAGLDVLRRDLLVLADLVTPNLPEAAALLGGKASEAEAWSRRAREEAAVALRALGASAVLLKGGHAAIDAGRVAADVLATSAGVQWLEAPWIEAPHVHGGGCALSAAITARLTLGEPLERAVALAKAFLGERRRREVAAVAPQPCGD